MTALWKGSSVYEPSESMIEAGAWHNHRHNSEDNMIASFKAMMAQAEIEGLVSIPDGGEAVHTGQLRDTIKPSSPPPSGEVREAVTLTQAFEIGYAWRGQLTGQTLEDSRAVGRTLQGPLFDGLKIDLSGWNSFEDADLGICDAKRRIIEALAALSTRDETAPEFLAKSASNSTGEAALPEAPEGWVLVPREPKVEMVAAFWRVKNGHHFDGEPPPPDTSDYAAYRAMLAAAPPPPPVAELPEHIAGMVFNWAREAQEEIDAHGEWLQEHNEEPDPGMDWIEIHPESLIRLEIALRPFASRAPTDTGEGR